jgi:hypothetical protein
MDPVEAKGADGDRQTMAASPSLFGQPPVKTIGKLIEQLQYYTSNYGADTLVEFFWPGTPPVPVDDPSWDPTGDDPVVHLLPYLQVEGQPPVKTIGQLTEQLQYLANTYGADTLVDFFRPGTPPVPVGDSSIYLNGDVPVVYLLPDLQVE